MYIIKVIYIYIHTHIVFLQKGANPLSRPAAGMDDRALLRLRTRSRFLYYLFLPFPPTAISRTHRPGLLWPGHQAHVSSCKFWDFLSTHTHLQYVY